MGHIDKLQQSRLIADALQQAAADGIGHEGRCTFLDDAVAGQSGKTVALDLAVELMLAAGNREDHLSAPLDGIIEGMVGGGIAGMEGNDHIGCLFGGIACNVAQLKAQTCITILEGGQIAAGNNIGLEVKTDDGGGQTTDFGEVVVEDKGQIGLAAAEVDDGDILTTMLANGIVDHLDKTVDLTVFVLHFCCDLTFGGKDTQIDQRRNNRAFGQQVVLLTVMALGLLGLLILALAEAFLALFGDAQGTAAAFGEGIGLLELGRDQCRHIGFQAVSIDILVENLLFGILLGLVVVAALARLFIDNDLADGTVALTQDDLECAFQQLCIISHS